MDLTKPITELQGVQIPSEIKRYYPGNWNLNGAFQFTNSSQRGAWNSGSGTLSPRVGFAYRLSNKTSIRAAFGRYMTPWNMQSNASDQFSPPYTGFANYTDAPPAVQGRAADAIVESVHVGVPGGPSYGKQYGAYTGIGDNLTFFTPNRPRAYSNRINISVQRQLPTGHRPRRHLLPEQRQSHITTVNYNINQVDPRIAIQYGAATNATVTNPFYHLAIPNQSPGALWNQATVGVTTLARPYPQYGSLTMIDGISGGDMTYHSLQMKATKSFSNGYTLLLGYNYHVQANQSFYDNVDNYLKNWTSLDSGTPRHRITAAGTWAITRR